MIFSLLDDPVTTPGDGKGGNDYTSWIMLAILAVLIIVVVVMYVLGNKKRKKQEQDAKDLINAVKPGNKVKTIGGICGIVVEVDDEENTFVLETGTELSGKSYIKFDRQAIYQTDAVVEKPEENAEQQTEATGEEAPATEETPAEDNGEEAPATEETAETAVPEEADQPAAKAKKNKKKN